MSPSSNAPSLQYPHRLVDDVDGTAPSSASSTTPVTSVRAAEPPSGLRLVPSPGALVDRCADDPDSPAWEELVTRYGRHLRRGVCRALRRCGQPVRRERVDDLVQEAYCRLLEGSSRRLRTFRGAAPAELGAWLQRLAERTAIDCLRAETAAKRGRDLVVPEAAVGEGPPDPAGSPQRRIEQRERLRHFAHRCRALAPDERAVRILKLVLVGGWTSREVARASRGAFSSSRVDSMIHRLRRRLAAEGLPLADRSGRRSHRRSPRQSQRPSHGEGGTATGTRSGSTKIRRS